MNSQLTTTSRRDGFVLIEALAAIFVLTLLGVALFSVATIIIKTSLRNEYVVVAQRLAANDIERIRLMPYDTVGFINGTPDGLLADNESLNQNGQVYGLNRTITLIDDPINGAVTGALDEASADYKQVQITVTPPGGTNQPVRLVSIASRPSQSLQPPTAKVHLPLERPGDANAFYPEIQSETDQAVVTDVAIEGAYNGRQTFASYGYSFNNYGPSLGFSEDILRFTRRNIPSVSDYISGFPAIFPLDVDGSYTISFWINPTQYNLPGPPFFSINGTIMTLPGRFQLSLIADRVLFYTRQRTDCAFLTTGNQAASQSGSLTAGTQVHVAAVNNAITDQITVYVNGMSGTAGSTSSFGPASCSGGLLIGAERIDNFGRPVNALNGVLDDIRIFDTALTPQQINELAGL